MRPTAKMQWIVDRGEACQTWFGVERALLRGCGLAWTGWPVPAARDRAAYTLSSNVSGNLGCTGRVCALKLCSRCARHYLAKLTSVYCKPLFFPDQTDSLGCTLTDAHLFDRCTGVEDAFRGVVKLGGCTDRDGNLLDQSILSVTAFFASISCRSKQPRAR